MLLTDLCIVFFVGIVTSRFCEGNARCTNLERFEIVDSCLSVFVFTQWNDSIFFCKMDGTDIKYF